MRINLRDTKPMKRDLVYTTGELPTRPFDATRFLTPSPHQNRCRRPRVEKVGLIMARLDRSRPARMVLALFGVVSFAILGVILGVVREAGWLSLIFALAFALALLLELAGGWQETTRRSRRRLLQAFSFVVGVIV